MAIFKKLFPNIISSISATSAEANRTATIDVQSLGAESVGFGVSVVRVAGSAITLQIHKSFDGGTTYHRIPSKSTVSGAATVNDYTETKAMSSSGTHTFAADVPCLNCTHVKFIVGVTGGGVEDRITCQACAGGTK
jgi:hypothetical protein